MLYTKLKKIQNKSIFMYKLSQTIILIRFYNQYQIIAFRWNTVCFKCRQSVSIQAFVSITHFKERSSSLLWCNNILFIFYNKVVIKTKILIYRLCYLFEESRGYINIVTFGCDSVHLYAGYIWFRPHILIVVFKKLQWILGRE